MPIKRSAVLLIMLAAGSFSLLVFSAVKAHQAASAPAKALIKCSNPVIENNAFYSWDMLSQIILKPAA